MKHKKFLSKIVSLGLALTLLRRGVMELALAALGLGGAVLGLRQPPAGLRRTASGGAALIWHMIHSFGIRAEARDGWEPIFRSPHSMTQKRQESRPQGRRATGLGSGAAGFLSAASEPVSVTGTSNVR